MYHLQLSRLLPFFPRGEILTRFCSRCSSCQRKSEISLAEKLSLHAIPRSFSCRDLKMKREEDKKKNRRKTLHSLCSVSALLLSIVCCMALIHVELRIQEHHRLMSHSVTVCDQMETQILRKVQQNYERKQATKTESLKGKMSGP